MFTSGGDELSRIAGMRFILTLSAWVRRLGRLHVHARNFMIL